MKCKGGPCDGMEFDTDTAVSVRLLWCDIEPTYANYKASGQYQDSGAQRYANVRRVVASKCQALSGMNKGKAIYTVEHD